MEIKDLIEEWITMRAMLTKELSMIKSGEMRSGKSVSDSTTSETIARLEDQLSNLNALLKLHASAT